MEFDEKLMKRIWSHIEKTDTCWLGKYAPNTKGYTNIGIGNMIYRFHRIMLFWSDQSQTAKFKDGENWQACHTCPNKHCVNPAHLYWGTPQDNSNDSIKFGTQIFGERCPRAKLTEIQVKEIRAKYANGNITQRQLSIEYGVNPPAINNIINGRRWNTYQIPL
jgi:hypothetical protein